MELLLQLVGELLLQAFVEALLQLGLHALAEPFRRPPNPWIAALGFTLIGALVGAFSLVWLPEYLVRGEALRLANLLLTPVLVGAMSAAVGACRARRGEPLLRIDRFAWGWLFACSLALVRYSFAD